MESLNIICTSYNRKDLTEQWLKDIEQCWPAFPTTVTIVDDCSTDGTGEFLLEYARNNPNIEVILKTTNTGFADTCRIGQAGAKSDWVLITQNDVVFSPGSIMALINTFNDLVFLGENVGCIGASGGMIHPDLSISDYTSWNGDGVAGYERKVNFKYEKVDFVDGWLMLYRGGVAREKEIQFDPQYRFYWEDVDLCYQFKKHGMSIFMVGLEQNGIPPIHHIRNQTIVPLVPEYKKIMADMKGVFRSKWQR